MFQSGVYAIRHKESGKVYVGSSYDVKNRWRTHKKRLFNKNHHSILLQRAYNLYGLDAFEFVILEIYEPNPNLLTREQHWIDFYQSANSNSGYNICPIAGSQAGKPSYMRTHECNLKMSLALKGKRFSKEHRKKLSESRIGKIPWNKGKPMYDNVKIALRNSRLGKPLSEEHKQKLSRLFTGTNNPFYGKKHSAETLAKIQFSRKHKKDTL